MEFKTSISKVSKDGLVLRGEKLIDLMEDNFSDVIFFTLLGRKPSSVESKIFSAMLISVVDHGMGTTSSLTSRFVMSGGNSMNTAVGAGVLALGDYHGGAIEKAMGQYLGIEDVVKFVKENKIIFGFGHKVYKNFDPRVKELLKLCNKLGYKSKYINLVLDIEKEIKKVCLNVDGFIAAVLLEMGFNSELGKGVFIIGRVVGLVAQAYEEKLKEKPVRRIDEESIEYTGDLKFNKKIKR